MDETVKLTREGGMECWIKADGSLGIYQDLVNEELEWLAR